MRPNAAWVDCSSPAGAGSAGTLTVPKLRARFSRAMRVRSSSASTPGRALSPTPSSGSHSRPSRNAHRVAQRGDLGRVHQAGVIVLVAGEGQAVALDRPGDEQGRDVVLRRVERLDQRFHAMAAEVGEQRRQRGVVMRLEERRRRLAEIGLDPRPPRRAALVVERRQVGVGQRLEPALQLRILVERGLQPLAVAQLDHAPAAASENLVEPLEHAVGAGRVEALAVVVDDPPQVADVVLVRPRSALRRYCPRRARHRRSARRSGRGPPRPSGRAR